MAQSRAEEHNGGTLGADNTRVYGQVLGISETEIARLQAEGVIQKELCKYRYDNDR